MRQEIIARIVEMLNQIEDTGTLRKLLELTQYFWIYEKSCGI